MSKRRTLGEFINLVILKHGDKYDYSKVVYVNSLTKVCISCVEHGEFWQLPNTHLKGHGCAKCAFESSKEKLVNRAKKFRPNLSHVKTPIGSKAVPLTRGKYTLVDEGDYRLVMEHNWNYDASTGYAKNKRQGSLHRFLLNAPKGEEVDHKDGDKLNNTRGNLRLCTSSQNSMNMRAQKGSSSQYRGVSWDKVACKWYAYISVNGKSTSLGKYEKEEDAAAAYDAAAKVHFKEFAYLNLEGHGTNRV